MSSDSLYLDFNATSPLSTTVSQWLKSGDLVFANPSSQHSLGKLTRKTINESRAKIYKTFNEDEKKTRLFFHSGATEAFVTIAFAMAEKARTSGKKLLVCTSPLDHPAVTSLVTRYWGDQVSFLSLRLTENLQYDYDAIFKDLQEKKLRDPGLMVLYHHLWVHNETGLVSSLATLEQLRKIPDLLIHVDAVQSPGKILDWKNLSCGDIFTFSAHKFGALKGVGFTFVREGVPMSALFSGGGQQQGLRGGTENALGVKTVALALDDLEKVDILKTKALREQLEAFMETQLQSLGGIVKGPERSSNTIYFYLNKFPSDIALALFDMNGLMISAGSACSSGAARPSAVLLQLGKVDVAKNGLRISLPFTFDQEDFQKVRDRLAVIFAKLKAS